jgi:hypothetical protein
MPPQLPQVFDPLRAEKARSRVDKKMGLGAAHPLALKAIKSYKRSSQTAFKSIGIFSFKVDFETPTQHSRPVACAAASVPAVH